MAEKTPDIASLEQAQEAIDSVLATEFLLEIDFPAEPNILIEKNQAELWAMRERLDKKIQELSFDGNGNVINENRNIVEFLAERANLLDKMIGIGRSDSRSVKEMFDAMRPA